MKVHYFYIIILTLSVWGPGSLAAQQAGGVEGYRAFQLPSDRFPDFRLMPVTDELAAMNMKSNPGVSSHDYLKSFSCIECDTEAIEEVYFEYYESQELPDKHLGLLVKKYRNEEAVQADIAGMKVSDNTLYFRQGQYLILFWINEDEETDLQEAFDIITVHYQGKGMSMLAAGQLADTEFDLIDFSDPAYVREKYVQTGSDRSIRYLFAADGGFIVFYNDGTVAVCGKCILCREQVDKVSAEPPFSIYQVNEDRIMIHSPDIDVSQPFFLELHHNEEVGEWYMIDYKEAISLPSECR